MDFGGNCFVGPASQGSGSVAEDFPRVLSYGDRTSGALLLGSTSPAAEVTLNDQAYEVGLKTAPKVTTYRAVYTPLLPGLPGVEISAALDIPGHDPIPVGSTDAGVENAFTGLDSDFT
ncbi:hypothetical protein [Streptomyces sp. NPDC055134]